MKKIVIVIMSAFLLLSCSNNIQVKEGERRILKIGKNNMLLYVIVDRTGKRDKISYMSGESESVKTLIEFDSPYAEFVGLRAEDIFKANNKAIVLKVKIEGANLAYYSIMNTIYVWDKKSHGFKEASSLPADGYWGSEEDNTEIYFRDMDGDGIKEIIRTGRQTVFNNYYLQGNPRYTSKEENPIYEVYKWNEKSETFELIKK